MDFDKFFDSLQPVDQDAFAKEAGTTVGYINAHLKRGRKIPRSDIFEGLVRACERFGAEIPRERLAIFFYDQQREHVTKAALKVQAA